MSIQSLKSLIVFVFSTFLACVIPVQGMETHYAKIKPKSSWIQVAMNDGKYAHIPASSTNSYTFWTDELKGCVVTLLNFEHRNGDHTLAMSHFSPDKKEYNEYFLSKLFENLECEGAILTIKKASCIIVPPGIQDTNHLKPIIDKKWQSNIINALHAQIPSIAITIEPYLFNRETSCVKYSLESHKATGMIINRSCKEDVDYQELLLVCHGHQEESLCMRLTPIILAATGIFGFLLYNSN